MISHGFCNLDKKEILSRISEADIAAHYLNVTEIPCVICSPLRNDKHPSFRVYSPDGKRVRYYDYATKDKGSIIDLVMRLRNISYNEALNLIYQELSRKQTNHISISKSELQLTTDVRIHTSSAMTYKVQSRRRAWENYDFEYWQSYGVPRNWLLHSDIYPISHIIITSQEGYRQVIKADKYAYTFIERKDGMVSEKIYQPYNKQGRKWRNSHDSSVWDLWTKLPASGDKVIITSSRKDALCIWANTHIPSVSLQSEAANIKPQVMNELKSRFKQVYVLYDNDFKNEVNNGRIDGRNIANVFGIKQIEIPTEYYSKDISDLYHNYGAAKVREVISELVKL